MKIKELINDYIEYNRDNHYMSFEEFRKVRKAVSERNNLIKEMKERIMDLCQGEYDENVKFIFNFIESQDYLTYFITTNSDGYRCRYGDQFVYDLLFCDDGKISFQYVINPGLLQGRNSGAIGTGSILINTNKIRKR